MPLEISWGAASRAVRVGCTASAQPIVDSTSLRLRLGLRKHVSSMFVARVGRENAIGMFFSRAMVAKTSRNCVRSCPSSAQAPHCLGRIVPTRIPFGGHAASFGTAAPHGVARVGRGHVEAACCPREAGADFAVPMHAFTRSVRIPAARRAATRVGFHLCPYTEP